MLQLLIQPWINVLGTHYGCMDQGSVEYNVCPTFLYMTSAGNRPPGFLMLSPMPHPFAYVTLIIYTLQSGQNLVSVHCVDGKQSV